MTTLKNKKDEVFLPCHQNKTDCASYRNGICDCLIDTDFGKRACPFYKNKAVAKQENKEIEKKLREKETKPF